MTDPKTGLKKRLTINACAQETDGSITVFAKNKFEVMLNPSNYTHKHAINYSTKKTLGQLASDLKFNAIEPEDLNFTMIIDGTGAVQPVTADTDVKAQIQQLKTLVYEYNGEQHETNILRLLWGSLIFFARLTSMSIDYTLFKPSGEPLRAKVSLAFKGFMSNEEEKLKANRSSPDLSHRVEVKSGDTLPLLCYRVYNDCSYYRQVAKINNLSDFRNLTPGLKLHFPPLR